MKTHTQYLQNKYKDKFRFAKNEDSIINKFPLLEGSDLLTIELLHKLRAR